jgi:hypothetical protein
MGIVSTEIAIAVPGYLNLFFATMMMFFPTTLLDSYSVDMGAGKSVLVMVSCSMAMMGLQLWHSFAISRAINYPTVDMDVKGQACFAEMLGWIYFILDDTYSLFIGKTWPEVIPTDGYYFNLFLWTSCAFLSYTGWKNCGGEMPTGVSMPEGRPKWGLIVAMANNVPYVIGLMAFTGPFMEMYVPGLIASMPNQSGALVLYFMENMGKLMMLNLVRSAMIINVANEGDAYRLQRVWGYYQIFYMGMLSIFGIVNDAMGWANPMKIAGFVQTFATTFFNVSQFGSINFKLAANPKPKKA